MYALLASSTDCALYYCAHVYYCTDCAHVWQTLAWVHANLPPIGTFVHAAGVIGFDTFQSMTEQAFWAVCAGKIVGASVLQSCGIPMMDISLLSSTAAVWSQPGAAHYAAGNAFLDATSSIMR